MNDGGIIDLFFARDELAIAESDAKYGRYCMTVAGNILSAKEDCEECVSDTWLAAWHRIPPEIPSCLRAFFGRITRNIAIDKYRMQHAEKRGGGEIAVALDELECIASSENDASDMCITAELADKINAFLRTLSERDCNIFLARYYYIYPVDKIADAFGLRENYVRTVLSRTRAKLAVYLKNENLL